MIETTRDGVALGAAVLFGVFGGIYAGAMEYFITVMFPLLLPLAVPLPTLVARRKPWQWLLLCSTLFTAAYGLMLFLSARHRIIATEISLMTLGAFIFCLLLGLPGTLLVVLVRWYKSRK